MTTKTTRFNPNGFWTSLGLSIKALAAVVLKSHRAKLPQAPNGDEEIIILGNGPSLRQTMDSQGDRLKDTDCMAVNFFANTDDFRRVKPKFYILADPHFFRKTDDPNVGRLIENINSASWKMTLLIPFSARKAKALFDAPNVETVCYNAIGAEGFPCLTNHLYRSGRAMPRPRNVLIPAIMTAIAMGYKRVFIAGADHSWTRTLSVDDDNCVVSVQPHFYKEDEHEEKRVRKEYLNYPLHKILDSFRIAFMAYHRIAAYAAYRGVSVVNVTPGSFIDAFPRGTL